MLTSEEVASNELMADYSSKLNHLLAIRDSIKQV